MEADAGRSITARSPFPSKHKREINYEIHGDMVRLTITRRLGFSSMELLSGMVEDNEELFDGAGVMPGARASCELERRAGQVLRRKGETVIDGPFI